MAAPAAPVVTLASASQYAHAGGSSACTVVCAVAAAALLARLRGGAPLGASAALLDALIAEGAAAALAAGGHLSFEEAWALAGAPRDARVLAAELPGSLADARCFERLAAAARALVNGAGAGAAAAAAADHVAHVRTKPPITLLLLVPRRADSGSSCFVFDSHAPARLVELGEAAAMERVRESLPPLPPDDARARAAAAAAAQSEAAAAQAQAEGDSALADALRDSAAVAAAEEAWAVAAEATSIYNLVSCAVLVAAEG